MCLALLRRVPDRVAKFQNKTLNCHSKLAQSRSGDKIYVFGGVPPVKFTFHWLNITSSRGNGVKVAQFRGKTARTWQQWANTH